MITDHFWSFGDSRTSCKCNIDMKQFKKIVYSTFAFWSPLFYKPLPATAEIMDDQVMDWTKTLKMQAVKPKQ